MYKKRDARAKLLFWLLNLLLLWRSRCRPRLRILRGTLSNGDDDSENVAKKMNLLSFKFNRVFLDPLNMSNAGDFSWS